ncbi:MAG: FAD:protein FMN transferase [Tissierellaceae bacterium]|nr:FAD:protein FMN transferase [Tissierellaceae bacterium]
MKKTIAMTLVIIMVLSTLVGCTETYTKYDYTFYGSFDTIMQVVAYTKNEKEFSNYMKILEERFFELHKLYDRFNNYDGLNNIKTINDNAGIKPVKVEREIIDLILFAKDLYNKTGNLNNIAMGSVTDIWNDYREEGINDPENAKLPPMDLLIEAQSHVDMDKIIVNEEESTVYLEDPKMILDVGAVAKGFATEIVAKEIQEEGLKSALISAGGNIRAIGKPLDDIRDKWGVGIQNPDTSIFDTGRVLETIFITDSSVVSSGDHQRYYFVNDKRYHHIVHPETLMPTDYYRQVTIVTPHSGMADFYSTAVFLLPFEESKQLVDSIDNLEAAWVLPDGTIEASEGMKDIMLSYGATGAIKK